MMAGIALCFLFVATRMAKWVILARANDLVAPTIVMVRSMLFALALGIVTPGRVGEAVAILPLPPAERARSILAYLYDRLGELATVVLFCVPAALAFLAVFREGAETTVFYLGMAPAIALRDLLLGLGIGIGALIVAALLILVAGVKLPLRPFFRVAGVLVYYLGFKFVGAGIHSLQVAGLAPATLIPGLPAVPFLGFYPIWETVLPQLVLLLGALAAFLYLRARDRRAGAANATVTA